MSTLEPKLTPPATKPVTSAVRVDRAWYVACRSNDLAGKPLAVTLLGTPLVLFRENGTARALLDRCAHRNVPLSFGRVVENGRLECRYHGWQFDGEGACRAIPALCGDPVGKGRRVPSYATVEQDGFVWVWGMADEAPPVSPFKFPHLDDPSFTTLRAEITLAGTVHAAAENALDVPHTAFLHRGLFRSGARREITAIVRRFGDRVEAEYVGESRPEGLAARLLAPAGGEVKHFDRFILPCITQVEYALSEREKLVVTTALTPVRDFETRMYAVISFRLRIPGALVKPLFAPIALYILRQDAKVLRLQTEAVERFGGEQFVSTPVDLLGPHILRLLKSAARGEAKADAPVEEERVPLLV